MFLFLFLFILCHSFNHCLFQGWEKRVVALEVTRKGKLHAKTQTAVCSSSHSPIFLYCALFLWDLFSCSVGSDGFRLAVVYVCSSWESIKEMFYERACAACTYRSLHTCRLFWRFPREVHILSLYFSSFTSRKTGSFLELMQTQQMLCIKHDIDVLPVYFSI